MLTANDLRDYIMNGLTCDHVEVQGDEIGRASCRERVYIAV